MHILCRFEWGFQKCQLFSRLTIRNAKMCFKMWCDQWSPLPFYHWAAKCKYITWNFVCMFLCNFIIYIKIFGINSKFWILEALLKSIFWHLRVKIKNENRCSHFAKRSILRLLAFFRGETFHFKPVHSRMPSKICRFFTQNHEPSGH